MWIWRLFWVGWQLLWHRFVLGLGRVFLRYWRCIVELGRRVFLRHGRIVELGRWLFLRNRHDRKLGRRLFLRHRRRILELGWRLFILLRHGRIVEHRVFLLDPEQRDPELLDGQGFLLIALRSDRKKPPGHMSGRLFYWNRAILKLSAPS